MLGERIRLTRRFLSHAQLLHPWPTLLPPSIFYRILMRITPRQSHVINPNGTDADDTETIEDVDD